MGRSHSVNKFRGILPGNKHTISEVNQVSLVATCEFGLIRLEVSYGTVSVSGDGERRPGMRVSRCRMRIDERQWQRCELPNGKQLHNAAVCSEQLGDGRHRSLSGGQQPAHRKWRVRRIASIILRRFAGRKDCHEKCNTSTIRQRGAGGGMCRRAIAPRSSNCIRCRIS
jgi:hypothetical protein